MFKKGFLNKGSKIPQTVKTTQQEGRRITEALKALSTEENLTPFGALPIELIVTIVEHLVRPREASTQRDLASIRCASKHFCRIATPHFYKVLQLANSPDHASLIAQLQAQPKLCSHTQAIWWSEWYGADRIQTITTSRPYLCKFPNVQDVAYFINIPISCIGSPMGLHLAFRHVGQWCASVKLPKEYILKQQCTPTVRLKQTSNAPKAELEQPTRAVWALRLVVPTLSGEVDMFYGPPKTLTHLTIDLYDHPDLPLVEDSVYAVMEHMLSADTLPLLQHLRIRMLDLGSAPYGLPTQEDLVAARGQFGSHVGLGVVPEGERSRRAVAVMEEQQWAFRSEALQGVIREINDPRIRFEAVRRPTVTRSRTRLEDVRKATLAGWQERAFRFGSGPWQGLEQMIDSDE